MATEIKRVRFFDGQFLKELEFRDEQAYHMHLRRRMNYFLFGQSGVVQLSPDELKFFDPNVADRTFRVRAGMAMCRSTVDVEGKEIILFQDSPAIDLDTEGVVAGGTGFVTLHYEQEEVKDPASEGDVDENTRVKEKAVLDVHTSAPPSTAPNGEEYIRLGTVAFDTMAFDYTTRHEARLRASLIGPVVAAPVVLTLSGVTSASPGGPAVAAVIGGLNLSGATTVVFSDPGVTAVVGLSTPATVNITVSVAPGVLPGPKSFIVSTPGGSAPSPGLVNFAVTPAVALPTITSIDVHTVVQGATNVSAVISGMNLTGASAVAFAGGGITAAIQPGGNATTVPIKIDVNVAAAAVARLFSVTTPSGVANSSGASPQDFTVNPLPIISAVTVLPTIQTSPNPVQIRGLNIRNAAITVGNPAAGTQIRFVDSVNTATVLAGPFTPTALADVGANQQVSLALPPGAAFTPPQAPGSSRVVKVRVDFNSAIGFSSGNLTINFP